MKLAIPLLAMMMPLYPAAVQSADWTEHPYDKASHIVIGGALSCVVSIGTGNKWYGLLAAVSIGTAKELSDENFDGGDFASWVVGGAVGMMCWDWK